MAVVHNENLSTMIEVNCEYKDENSWSHPSNEQITRFWADGYAVFPKVFSQSTVNLLNHRLELVLRGEFDTGVKPDKAPKLIKTQLPKKNRGISSFEGNETIESENEIKRFALGYSGNKRKKVFQVINIHKSDRLFREFVTNPLLGMLVAKLMRWKEGARLCQDQVWAKPPGAPPLAFHRDSPYFMFDPSPVATVWIALDDMHDELGPLTYVKGSHKWGDGRVGSSQNFFQDDGGTALLFSAASKAGVSIESLEYKSMNKLMAGGISIHGECYRSHIYEYLIIMRAILNTTFLKMEGLGTAQVRIFQTCRGEGLVFTLSLSMLHGEKTL